MEIVRGVQIQFPQIYLEARINAFYCAAPRTDLFTGKYFLYISGFLNGPFILLYRRSQWIKKTIVFSLASRRVCRKRSHSTLEILLQFSFRFRRIYATKGRIVKSNLIFTAKEKCLSSFSFASSYKCKNRNFDSRCPYIFEYIENYIILAINCKRRNLGDNIMNVNKKVILNF